MIVLYVDHTYTFKEEETKLTFLFFFFLMWEHEMTHPSCRGFYQCDHYVCVICHQVESMSPGNSWLDFSIYHFLRFLFCAFVKENKYFKILKILTNRFAWHNFYICFFKMSIFCLLKNHQNNPFNCSHFCHPKIFFENIFRITFKYQF